MNKRSGVSIFNFFLFAEIRQAAEETSVPEKTYRVAFLGGAQVGKTSIIDQGGKFSGEKLQKYPLDGRRARRWRVTKNIAR